MPPPDERLGRWRSFRNVDAAADPGSLQAYLDDLAELPVVARQKRRSLSLLGLAPGAHCLDVGCGAGPELGWLAQEVGPEGSVVGLDRSRQLLDAAAGRHDDAVITLVYGDALALPFPDERFDGVRTDRTLQHVDDPARALSELVRVTRPGGRIVISEFRWGLVGPDLDRSITDQVLHALTPAEDRREWVGHRLAELAADAGLRHLEAVTETDEVEDAADMARLLNLDWSLSAAVHGGRLTEQEGRAWRHSLEAQARRGDAFAVLLFLHVAGTV
ncbi:MAG TPA: methyltransferase domain-containing protein [Solirubrobacteraceae bacterium]|jgi:ubiquinone/menaquinone biosynthesis C-methylase UbiE|nr:methyltransferase domain-containing protein [Solirubrobacteraceae bacterium]